MNGDMLGRVIKGRYKLIDELARGSFATVYVARDTENNHIYAVKIMHYELSSDDELLARFQREAHILMNLNDPHIARIIDHGNDGNTNFIVMDYIDGHTLKYHMITLRQMDTLRALNYTQQIVEGLDTAYKQGVIHRDIKPQNILINNKDVVKIADFGLARSRDTVTLTQSNVFMGTAYYIAPEQAESGRSADTRSDLYSVATVFFEMLTGTPPFEGETAVDIVIKHMNDPVPSICRIRHDLPPDMDVFMQKAMAKLPVDRYTTPQEFIAALEQIQERVQAQQPRANAQFGQSGHDHYMENSGSGKSVSAPPKQARLIVLSSGQAIPLAKELMVVGRQDPILAIFPEITLADKTVGRRHAYLRNHEGMFTVEDLNSLNFTRLNGVKLTPHEERPLKDGDTIRFGSVEVRFELR